MGMTGYMAEMRRLVGHRTVIQCAASVIVVDQQGRLLRSASTAICSFMKAAMLMW